MRMRPGPDDDGVTLIELMVAMTLMSVFGTIFVSGIAQMYRAANEAEAATTAQSQINVAFGRLDTEIRYATGLSTPGPATGTDRYVEYLTSNTGTEMCGELRLRGSTSLLQWRQWKRGDPPGGWTLLASGVSSATPFTVTPTSTGSASQTLTVLLTSAVSGRAKQFRTTFAALNSGPGVDTSAYCVEGRQAP
jgi:prepilin-type N-terminal cleavage/methylation domain-containing protein